MVTNDVNKRHKVDTTILDTTNDSEGKSINIGELLLENSKVLRNIQSKVTELNDLSRTMEARLNALESDRRSDKETLDCVQEQCSENRDSINFLHGVINDSSERMGMMTTDLEAKLMMANSNHANLVETVKNYLESANQVTQK